MGGEARDGLTPGPRQGGGGGSWRRGGGGLYPRGRAPAGPGGGAVRGYSAASCGAGLWRRLAGRGGAGRHRAGGGPPAWLRRRLQTGLAGVLTEGVEHSDPLELWTLEAGFGAGSVSRPRPRRFLVSAFSALVAELSTGLGRACPDTRIL